MQPFRRRGAAVMQGLQAACRTDEKWPTHNGRPRPQSSAEMSARGESLRHVCGELHLLDFAVDPVEPNPKIEGVVALCLASCFKLGPQCRRN
jgi:hypothetical protein